MIFGGQPTPWTQAEIDALLAHDERVRAAGGLLAYNEKYQPPSPELIAAIAADESR